MDHAIFSKEGPYLNKPADTNMPSVIPKKYRLKNKKGCAIVLAQPYRGYPQWEAVLEDGSITELRWCDIIGVLA